MSPERAATPPEVGERLRERRGELKLSVRELARRLQLSPSLISQIERGKASPSVGTLYALTNELDLSMDALFSESSNGQPEPGSRKRESRASNGAGASGGGS